MPFLVCLMYLVSFISVSIEVLFLFAKQILYAGGVFRLRGHCAVEGSVLNVITCIYACAPPFPGGSHVVVLNVAVRSLENMRKCFAY